MAIYLGLVIALVYWQVSDAGWASPGTIKTSDSSEDTGENKGGVLDDREFKFPTLNSTLGFGEIYYINLASRYDMEDTIALQNSVSGTEMKRIEALKTSDLSVKGLPPSSNNYEKTFGSVKAIFRSHAVAWRECINSHKSTCLILEADATWNKDIRQQMGRYSVALNQLMESLGKTGETHRKSNSWFKSSISADSSSDPYSSHKWDFMQLSAYTLPAFTDGAVWEYPDPSAHSSEWVFKREIPEGHRLVTHQADSICLGAYAVSRRGAQKLLLRFAIDLQAPADLITASMTIEKELETYSVWPAIFGQWEYATNINADEKNTDNDGNHNTVSTPSEEEQAAAWEKVHKSWNAWKPLGGYGNQINNHALLHLGEEFFGIQASPSESSG